MDFNTGIRESRIEGDKIKVACELQYEPSKDEITIALKHGVNMVGRARAKNAASISYKVYDIIKNFVSSKGGTFTTNEDTFITHIKKSIIDFGKKYKGKTLEISKEYNDFFFELYDVHNNGEYILPMSGSLPDIFPVSAEDEIEGTRISRLGRGVKNTIDLNIKGKTKSIR